MTNILILLAGIMLMASPLTARAESYEAYSTANDNTCSTLTEAKNSDEFYTKDNYAILYSTGNIYYYPNGVLFTDGIADDGNVYDEYGVQQNATKYVYDKITKQSPSGETMTFSGMNEMILYLRGYTHETCEGQFASFTWLNGDNGYTVKSLKNSDGEVLSGELPDEYYDCIRSFASQIDTHKSVEQQIYDVRDFARGYFSYNEGYVYTDMLTSVKDRQGVCYQYAKIMQDMLRELGIHAECVSGYYNSASHAWTRAWDNEQDRWIYLDGTVKSDVDNDVCKMYERYLDKYRQMNYKDTGES